MPKYSESIERFVKLFIVIVSQSQAFFLLTPRQIQKYMDTMQTTDTNMRINNI